MLEDGDWDWYHEKRRRRGSDEEALSLTGEKFPRSQTEHSPASGPSYPGMAHDPLDDAPADPGGFVRLRWGRIVVVVAVLAGGVAELAIIWVAYELVDLSISLMEVWAQLARKHLELTLFWHW